MQKARDSSTSRLCLFNMQYLLLFVYDKPGTGPEPSVTFNAGGAASSVFAPAASCFTSALAARSSCALACASSLAFSLASLACCFAS